MKLRNDIKTGVERKKKYNLPLSRQHNLSIEDCHRKQRKIPAKDEQTIQSQSRTLAMGRVGKFNSKEHSSLKPWGDRIIRVRQLDMFKMEEIKRNHDEATRMRKNRAEGKINKCPPSRDTEHAWEMEKE